MKRPLLCTILLTAWLAASPLASAATLRVHQDADIRSTDPGVNRDGNTDFVVLHMVEGLVGYNAKGEPKPLLAERIEVSEDGLSYTFHLRQNIKFHNGKTLTADDVLWSWQRYVDPKTGWRCLADFDGRVRLKVEDVRATDDHTVVFRINQPDPIFLSSLARSDCGMTAITHRDSLKADGTWDKPIGTGPFKLNAWRNREYISLVRFDGYASLPGEPDGYVGSKRPLVDEIRFVVISDPATAKAALLRGDIDIMTKVPYAEIREFANHPHISTTVSPQLATSTLLLQSRDKLLANPKLRQAIAAAIDYEQLVEGVTYGLATPNNSLVPSASPAFGDVQKQGFVHDLNRARQLLAEAGYKGEKIILMTNKRNTPNFDAAVIAQAMLQQAGINAEIEVLEWGVQHDRYQKGNYQMMSFSYSARMDPSLSFEAIMGPKDTQPRKAWDDPDSQTLLMRSMRETDPQQRQQLFDTLHTRMLAQVPMIPLYNSLSVGAYRNTVRGFKSSIFGAPQLWEVRKQD